jgi:predicted nucleic acid-binding protein
MILLDTDTYTLHQVGQERVVRRLPTADEPASITIVTQIEVLRGRHEALFKAADGARLLHAQQALARTLQHMAQFPVVFFDEAAAAVFDRLRQTTGLRRLGRGDLLIGSIALANRAILVTRNQKHFRKVPGLRIESWTD